MFLNSHTKGRPLRQSSLLALTVLEHRGAICLPKRRPGAGSPEELRFTGTYWHELLGGRLGYGREKFGQRSSASSGAGQVHLCVAVAARFVTTRQDVHIAAGLAF